MKNGWPKRVLSNLYEVGSSKRVLKSEWKTAGVPFYRGREITRLAADGFVDNELFIAEKHFAELSNRYGVPKAGDIVITAIGTIGNSHVVRTSDRFYFKDASVLWLKRIADISSEFVNLWLKSPAFFDQLDRGNGATVDTLTIQKLQSVTLALPPLPEQRRIVGILDEAFAGIATAKANAEKNLRNARELFESELHAVFAREWEPNKLVSLTALATDITDGDHLPPPKSDEGVPFITIGNIDKNTRKIDFSDTFKVPRTYFDALKPNRKPRNGDVLYTVTGSFGIPVIVDNDQFCFQRHIGLVRPNAETDTRWLYYLLLSPQVFDQANDKATGAAQRTVSLKALRAYTVPRVPLRDQRSAVAQLDKLSAASQHLASLYQQKLAALDALKKSLLHRAFSGELGGVEVAGSV